MEVIDTYQNEVVPVETEDALAKFRQQAKAELAEKATRSKMSDVALSKLQAADKNQDALDARLSAALRLIVVTDANLRTLITRCNKSVPVKNAERRAQKLGWFIAAGFRLGSQPQQN